MTVGIGCIDLVVMPLESFLIVYGHIGIQSHVIGGTVSVADGPAGLMLKPQFMDGGEPSVKGIGNPQYHLV